jgi:hypothetical protein
MRLIFYLLAFLVGSSPVLAQTASLRGPIIGNITSPLFGQANQPAGGAGFIFSEAANNRRLELQMRFTF